MYSPKVIQRNTHGLDLSYHSLAEVERAIAHFNSIAEFDDDGDWTGEYTRPLDKDELAFQRNETLLCKWDFNYASSRYARIMDWTKRLVPFTPNLAQRIKLDIYSELEERGVALVIQALKARQLGSSTLDELIVWHRVTFRPHTEAIVGSSDPEKSAKMFGMVERAWKHTPFWLKPECTKYSRGEFYEFGNVDSSVSIQHGTQFSGIGRGTTPSVAHLCFAPGTKVRGIDGRLVNIEDLNVGDQVLGSSGRLIRVQAKSLSSRRNEQSIRLYVWNTKDPLEVTKDHKIATSRGIVEASGITSQDAVLYPVRPLTRTKHHVSWLQRGTGKTKIPTPVTQPLSYDFGKALGLFLAEGCIHFHSREYPDCITFTGDRDQTDLYSEIVLKGFGKVSSPKYAKTSRSMFLNLYSSGAAGWVYEQFGHKDTKRLPDWVFDAPREFQLGLLHGYLIGDGHWKQDSNEIYATSVRPAIVIGLRELVASLGFGWSSISRRDAGLWYGRNCQEAWTWILAGATAKALREELGVAVPSEKVRTYTQKWEYTDSGCLALQVKKIEEGFCEYFWDIAVDSDDHLFATLQGLASNSEIVDYDEPEQLIDASLLRALHEHPEAYISLESTANGRGDWWHKTWVANKENLAAGMSKMYPVFLPWFVGRDIYPTETWLRARPVPAQWEPQDSTVQHAIRAADYVSRTPLLKRYLGESWTMPVEQMWWYEVERKWALQKNELNIFLSECPASDDEAFQSRTGSIFPIEIISDRREATTLPKWALSIDGDEIPQRLVVPATQLQSTPPLKLDYGYEPSKMTRLRGSFCGIDQNFDPTNKLCLWEMPQEGEEYEISIDTGYGVGEDRSVIQVGRRGTPERADAQVGEWASADAGALDLWPIVLAVGRLFTGVAHDGRVLEPRITVELAANGEALQAELRKRGWRNFYIRNRLATAVRSESIINPQLGWVTSHQSRQRLIDHLIKVVRDNLVEIRSQWLVDELADLQRSEKNFKIEAARGAHDDRLMSFAIMSYVMYDLDLRGEPSSMYRQRREAAAAAARAPEYSPGAQALPGWAPGMEDLLQ